MVASCCHTVTVLKPLPTLLQKFLICHGSTFVPLCSAVVGTVLRSYFIHTHVVLIAFEVTPLIVLGDLVLGIFLLEPQTLSLWEVVNS